jgi:peroxiredoxin
MIFQKRVSKLALLLTASCLVAAPALIVDSRPAQAAPESFASEPVCGKAAPEFTLTDTNGKEHKLRDYKGKFVVLEWFNQGCPFVKKHYDSGNMQKLQRDYTEKGVVWLSICSSAPGKQGNCSATEHNTVFKEKKASPTAILIDEDGKVGRLYAAKTTPDMFVINPKGVLIYSGAIDDKRDTDPSSVASARNFVREVLEEAMSGKKITVEPTASYGCSVKYL